MIPPSYKKPLTYSLILHSIILLLLLFQLPFHKSSRQTPTTPAVKIIQASTVSMQQIQAREKAITAEKAAAEAARKKAVAAKKRQQQQVAARRDAAKKAAAAKVAAKRAAAKKQADALAAKKAAAKRAAAKKQAAALAAKQADEQKAAAERQAKLAALQKQQAEEAKQQLQQQLAAEQASMVKAQAVNATVNQYTAMILTAIQNHFYNSVCAGKNLSCQLSVSLDGQGNVLSSKLVKSSGNPAFDRMAQNAVRAAAPFSLPTDPDAKAKMQQLNLLVAPCENN